VRAESATLPDGPPGCAPIAARISLHGALVANNGTDAAATLEERAGVVAERDAHTGAARVSDIVGVATATIYGNPGGDTLRVVAAT
jgi:hypothetical protein